MAELGAAIALGYEKLDPAKQVDPATMLLTALEIVNQCWKTDTKLRAFYTRLESETKGPIYWSEMSKGFNASIGGEDLGPVYPLAFHFQNLAMAHTCLVYWATTAILWSGMKFVYQLLTAFQVQALLQFSDGAGSTPPTTGFHPSLLPPLEHRVEVSAVAKNICQSLEYCTLEASGSAAFTPAVFPIKVAIEALNDDKECERELEWAKRAVDVIINSGIKLLAHIGVPLTDHAYIPG